MQITKELLSKFEFRVPRYTSYPTAPHFEEADNDSLYLEKLKTIANLDNKISLYIHVPYCDTLCWFCACNTTITTKHERIEAYLHYLKKEMQLLYNSVGKKLHVGRIHWGGGSPSLLNNADWQYMRASLDEFFHIASDAELSIELDPRDIDGSYISILKSVGINRASIGVQDFDFEVQKLINRTQTYEEISSVMTALKQEGFRAINLDVLYGLPLQTEESVAEMAKKVLSLNPDRIALFGYAHVPWMKPHQNHIDESLLPDSYDRYVQFKTIEKIFNDGGYASIGLDHFAKVDDSMYKALKLGNLHRNFQGYTDDVYENMIGIGPSSIGDVNNFFVQNVLSVKQWKEKIDNNMLPIEKQLELDSDDIFYKEIIERFMCDLQVDLKAIAKKHGKDVDFSEIMQKLEPFVEYGMAEVEDYKITLHMEYRLFCRIIASFFDEYLKKQKGKHSIAI